MAEKIYELERAALSIRKQLLKLCTMQVIHIGGDLSITDVMTVLWQYQMRYHSDDPEWEDRDRFVLSKGHASAVVGFNQAAIGCFQVEEIYREYAADGGRFSMHFCNLVNPYIEVSTGSLGHGMPVACGMAAALRLKGNSESRVYTVMGDGEHSEGSVWEAAMNAVHYKLGNLVAIVDCNGLEADGSISEITGLGKIADKYRAFGWKVCELNGHDISGIKSCFDMLPAPDSEVPTVFICHTVKGKGVSFMENEVKWHAGKITEAQYYECLKHLNAAFIRRWSSIDG